MDAKGIGMIIGIASYFESNAIGGTETQTGLL